MIVDDCQLMHTYGWVSFCEFLCVGSSLLLLRVHGFGDTVLLGSHPPMLLHVVSFLHLNIAWLYCIPTTPVHSLYDVDVA